MSDFAQDDPFVRLDLPRTFDLADTQIEQAYLAKASQLHPDRFSDPVEQAEAVRESALVNDARRTLLDEETRARTLLRLLGGGETSKEDDLPEGFLMEILEVREEMEADFGDSERRQHWEQWAREQRRDYLDRVGALFRKASTGEGSLPDDIAADIRRQLNAWRYIERMIEQLDPSYDHAAELRRAEQGGAD